MRKLVVTMFMLSLLVLSFSAESRTPHVFEKIELDVSGRRILVLWQRLEEPDVIVGYCGVNYIYFDPNTRLWDQTLVEWNVSRYVGPPDWYTPGDPKSVARLNAERIATYNELMEAFERAGACRYGWYGLLDLIYYFEWEPRVLGILAYLGGVKASADAKLNKINVLLENVLHVLEKYNISIVLILETDTMMEPERSLPAAHALGRALVQARMQKEEIPEVVRRYVVEGRWVLGNSFGVVGLAFGLEPPDEESIRVLVRWIRDGMGYCEIPLVIGFNAPMSDGILLPLKIDLPSTDTPTTTTNIVETGSIAVTIAVSDTNTSYDEEDTMKSHDVEYIVRRSSPRSSSPLILILLALLVIATWLLIIRKTL